MAAAARPYLTWTRVAHLLDGRRRAELDELLVPGPSSSASVHDPASCPGTPFLVPGAAGRMARIRPGPHAPVLGGEDLGPCGPGRGFPPPGPAAASPRRYPIGSCGLP